MKSRENNETFGKSQKIQEIAKKKINQRLELRLFSKMKLRTFREIRELQGNSGKLRKIREITGDFREITYHKTCPTKRIASSICDHSPLSVLGKNIPFYRHPRNSIP